MIIFYLFILFLSVIGLSFDILAIIWSIQSYPYISEDIFWYRMMFAISLLLVGIILHLPVAITLKINKN